jgi:hypothetical protein
MAYGKCLELRKIQPKKHYAEKAGDLRILADGTVYRINRDRRGVSRGWKYMYKKRKSDGELRI